MARLNRIGLGVRSPRLMARRGASVIESAFVIPVLALLVFSGFELGAVMHMRQSMLHAARESARVLAVQGGSIAEAEATALSLLPNADLPWELEFTTPAEDSLDREISCVIRLPLGSDTVGVAIGSFDDDAALSVRVSMRSER